MTRLADSYVKRILIRSFARSSITFDTYCWTEALCCQRKVFQQETRLDADGSVLKCHHLYQTLRIVNDIAIISQ